jgi:hypothetical protein
MDKVYSNKMDLMDTPVSDPELKLFIDGSSFVQGGQQKARFTVTSVNDIRQAEALPQGRSAQKAELQALVQTL